MWFLLSVASGVALYLVAKEIKEIFDDKLFSYAYIEMPPTSNTVTFKRKDGTEVTFTKTGVRAAKRKAEKANKEVEKLSAKKQKTESK